MSKALKKMAVSGALLLLMTSTAHAQSRSETLKLVVPYTAGGVADSMARRIAELARQDSQQIIIVENSGGAGGTIGAANVARANPDGRTFMLVSTSALTIGPSLNRVSYNPKTDFTPIRSVAVSPVAIVATKEAPFSDLKGVIDYAKRHPGAVRYGTPGLGSVAHLAMGDLQAKTGVKMTHVPYRGDGPAIQDALGGAFEILVLNTPTLLPHVSAGTLRPLAVMEPKRLGVWPMVPTLVETGFDGMVYRSDFGIFGPARMSTKDVGELSAKIDRAVNSDAFQKLLASNALLSGEGMGSAYGEQIKAEIERNAGIIKDLNIGP